MKKTFLEIQEADQIVGSLYAKDKTLEKGKFGYAWGRFIKKNYNPISEELNEKIIDNRVEHALVDEKTKELLYEGEGKEKSYKYSKDGMKALLEANRKLIKEFNKKEIEVIPFYISEENLPELLEGEREILTGLVIEEIKEGKKK